MSEALTALIAYAFNDLRLHRIMANYMPSNERSARVLQRLGFQVEGYARDYLFLAGRWQDHIMTSLTNPSWSASRE
jgi:ribosomal-protein-alanine N-acetyltransferase